MEILPAPEHLVDAEGRPAIGVFDGPPRHADLERARVVSRGVRLPPALARLRLKQWQHVALITPSTFVGLAIVDAGFLRTTWCHVVDRASGRRFEHSRKGPLLDLRVAPDLWDDRCHVRARGYDATIENRLSAGEHRILFEIAGDPAVSGTLRCPHDLAADQPLVVSLPVGGGRAMYSLKAALPLEGTLRVGDRTQALDPRSCHAIWDVHKAHYPRRTFWNWATFAGRDAAGRRVALNLTRNVNEDDATWNENAAWLDGHIEHLGPATFHFDPARPLDPWRLGTADGAVDLVFRPQGERREDLRAGLVESVFRQPYGTFDGTVRVRGERVTVEAAFGVCEDHRAVW
ncbi:MAG: hypothetical protein AMXMBFR64_56730 [Myxococcales bacterium]